MTVEFAIREGPMLVDSELISLFFLLSVAVGLILSNMVRE